MAFKINKPKTDLCSFPPYLIFGLQKVGKSTLFRDLVLENYGTAEKGLLISIGEEEGYHSLDDLQVAVAKNWNDDFDEEESVGGFEGIVDYIVENNKELGIKMVCLDTIDQLVDIATDEVLRLHKKEKGAVCKSLNDAFGGYGKGRERLKMIVKEQIAKLRSANIAVFCLGHCKVREKEDMMTGEKYDQLTNNLTTDMWSIFADIAQMIVCINIDKNIEDGKLLGTERMMYFKSNGLVDCGSRFPDMPEKLPLSASNFMKAFNHGVKASTGKTDEEIAQQRVDEEKENEIKAEKLTQNTDDSPFEDDELTNTQLVEKINTAVTEKTINTKDILKVLKDNGYSNLKEPDSIDRKVIESIVALIK